jgi:hypothetical protein
MALAWNSRDDEGRNVGLMKIVRGHDRQNPVSNSDVANLNSIVPNYCFIRTEFKRAQQNLRLQDRISNYAT